MFKQFHSGILAPPFTEQEIFVSIILSASVSAMADFAIRGWMVGYHSFNFPSILSWLIASSYISFLMVPLFYRQNKQFITTKTPIKIYELTEPIDSSHFIVHTIIKEHPTAYYFLSQLLAFNNNINKHYSLSQQKNIHFQTKVSQDFFTNKHIAILTILNFLTASTVDTITDAGEITLSVDADEKITTFSIKKAEINVIPEEQTTISELESTKQQDISIVKSTDITFSHITAIIAQLEGVMHTQFENEQTAFQIILPTKNILK